jgi:membrane-associated phospholipid phosphatase
MSAFLQTIQSIDVSVYYFLNRFAGNTILDHAANFADSNSLFKGGAFMAMYWSAWFVPGPGQEKRRRSIVAILVGVLLALVAARTLADLAPFRLRPMYDPQLQHRPYAFPISPKLVDWSAFPSDNAAFFCALAFGIAYVSRRLAVPAMLYALVWVCLPRLFMGVHWVSDIVTGGAIGIALVWAALTVEGLQSGLATRVLALADAAPRVFYAAAFLISFEMGVLFDDVRDVARGVFRVLPLALPEIAVHARLVTLGTLALLIGAMGLGFLGRKKWTVRIRLGGRDAEASISPLPKRRA